MRLAELRYVYLVDLLIRIDNTAPLFRHRVAHAVRRRCIILNVKLLASQVCLFLCDSWGFEYLRLGVGVRPIDLTVRRVTDF